MDTLRQLTLERPTRKAIKDRVNRLIQKVEFLMMHPVKFDPKYLYKINANKLEILALHVFSGLPQHNRSLKVLDVVNMTEKERRKLLEKIIKQMRSRKWSWEHIKSLMVALNYPSPKPSELRNSIQRYIKKLISRLKRDLKMQRTYYSDEIAAKLQRKNTVRTK